MNVTAEEAVSLMLNGGVDVTMISNKAHLEGYIKHIKAGLKNIDLFVSRLDDAVTKVLSVKLAMGLVETVGEPQ